jgi:magnesium transporter
MLKYLKKSSRKAGLAPGTLVYTGKKRRDEVGVSLISYDQDGISETEPKNLSELKSQLKENAVKWINVDGLHDTSIIEGVGEIFNIHPLILEDVLNTNQRPKIEEYDDHIFVVLGILTYDDKTMSLKHEQLSLILGRDYVLTFQEDIGDVFDPVRERIRRPKWREMKHGADYLSYALIDAIIDNYFVIFDKLSEQIETLERDVLERPSHVAQARLHRLKAVAIQLRKNIWPLREVLGRLVNGDSKLISPDTELFLRDTQDHIAQIIESIETLREMLSNLMEMYLSGISNRLNEVMKVLTIFASIFIPLTLIAGIYGMNFKYMPELQLKFGYPMSLAMMAAVAITLILYFRRKKWF